jgi:hypothetical protein
MWGLGQDTLQGIVVGLMWVLGQDILLSIIVGLCGASSLTQRWMWGLGQDTLLGIIIIVGLCGASGNTLYWVLLLVYVLRATLLGIAVGLCYSSGNTLYWLLLLVYEGPRTTLFAGYCCGLCEVLDNTLYWASYRSAGFINGFIIILFKWVHYNPFKKIIVERSKCRFLYLLRYW